MKKDIAMLVIGIFISVLICARIDIFLLDGIREDFLLDREAINKTYFPHLATSTLPSVKRTVLAETPTYTTNCLHAMYTGKVVHPLYVLLTLAPSMYAIAGGSEEDPCVLSTLRQRGYSMSVSGDDTLAKLFPRYFNQSQTAYSFNIGDYATVDNVVIQSLQSLWEGSVPATNQFSMYHLLGADHIAHTEGIMSSTLRERCHKYDMLISSHLTFLHDAWINGELDDYIVIVLSDHGMTDKGTHGGFSAAEVRTPFLLFTSSESLREGIEARMNQLIPQRHVLLHVLSELFSVGRVADTVLEKETETKTEAPAEIVSSLDIYIIIAYAILLLILSTVVVIHKRPISPILLMCQFLCAVADRFARNETVPLIVSLIMELIWKTGSNSSSGRDTERHNAKDFIKRHDMHATLQSLFYCIWTVCLVYITRSVCSLIPIVLTLLSYLLNTELRYILLRLTLKSMGHTELFSYKLPTIHLPTELNNSANPWSCAFYIFLTDGIPAIIIGNIYSFTNLANIVFSSLLFRWHPLYNSICISKLIIEIMIATFSLVGVSVRGMKAFNYLKKQ